MAQTLTFANLEKIIEKNNTTIKEWVNTKITDTSTFSITWVEELPTENISTSTIYMVKNTESTEENNIYDEYVYNETSSWEVLGSLNTGSIDLSDYYDKTQTYNKAEVDALFTNVNTDIETVNTKVDDIKKYQKYVNTDLEYCLCYGEKSTTYTDSQLPYNVVSILTNRYTNMEINNEGYILLKANKKYIISFDYAIYGGNDVNASIIDKDKNLIETVPSWKHPSSNSDGNPLTGFVSFSKDTYIGANFNQTNSNIFYGNHMHILIQEIGQKTIIDPAEYVNTTQGIEDTPVGHIISHMGNTAPKHYLICDGSEYNISEYPYLAQHFIDEFDSVNYFGGDGKTTFAVPDLRGEFLRGTGTALRNTGSGAEVGKHQDGTNHVHMLRYSNGNIIIGGKTTIQPLNTEKVINSTDGGRWDNQANANNPASSNAGMYYTSRPTNTSVLYCIKYEPTYFMQNIYTGYEEVVLWEGLVEYAGTNNKNVTPNINIELSDSVANYDEIHVYYGYQCKTWGSGKHANERSEYKASELTPISTQFLHIFGAILNIRMQVRITEKTCAFSSLYLSTTMGETFHGQIYKIVGLKTSYNKDGELVGTDYTEEDVTNAINELW